MPSATGARRRAPVAQGVAEPALSSAPAYRGLRLLLALAVATAPVEALRAGEMDWALVFAVVLFPAMRWLVRLW
jgi:hypothetical protein